VDIIVVWCCHFSSLIPTLLGIHTLSKASWSLGSVPNEKEDSINKTRQNNVCYTHKSKIDDNHNHVTTEEKLSIIIIRNYHTKYARLSPELLRRICVATQIAKPKNFQISICSQFILDNQITE
jgi:hypothetical protein